MMPLSLVGIDQQWKRHLIPDSGHLYYCIEPSGCSCQKSLLHRYFGSVLGFHFTEIVIVTKCMGEKKDRTGHLNRLPLALLLYIGFSLGITQ